ncbi:inactive serine/threonine-protein kinase VRK3 isoform X2 [Bombina bombina]|uniref:inactive serine/threonine-protein kinase VRK3 isoform X2 n=1 Tax=Bombina bombina TaxID=8345 RepID=UPI00235A92DD|nr:inactive serine/threonine-protein kinase VRK3 isoform X2 [Bombina bombina]
MIIHFCPGCGQKAEESFKFCPGCGLKLPKDDITEPPTSSISCSPTQKGVSPKRTRNKSALNKLAPEDAQNECSVTLEKREVKSLGSSRATSKGFKSPKAKQTKVSHFEPLPENEVVTDNSSTKWHLDKLLTKGNTGILYEVHSLPKTGKGQQGILKLDAKDGKIYTEQNFLQRAAKKSAVDKWTKSHSCSMLGIPNCIGFGVQDNYRFLIFSSLGQSIINFSKLSEKAVYQIMYRMIDTLEFIHENEYVHGDITPENIFVDLEDLTKVYLAGYYYAFRYCPEGKHVSYREGSKTPHEGTVMFISLDAHKGAGPCRRSDLESLGYCMLKWLSGVVPWEDQIDSSKIMEQKKRYKTDIPGLLKDSFNRKKAPEVLKTYLEQVMCLNYEEKPDYKKLSEILSAALHKTDTDPYDAVDDL